MEEETIDLRDLIKTIRKRRTTITKIFLSIVIFTAIVSFIIPPTYEAETTLRIKQPKGLADSMLAELPVGGGSNATKQLMSTYAEILLSRTVIQTVIDTTQSWQEKLPLYEDFIKRIKTQPVKDTEILKIQVRAQSPEEAEYIANFLVNTFLDRMTQLVRGEKKTVREFIGQRLAESKKELAQAETVLEDYKREQKIAAPDEEIKALVDRLADVNKVAADNQVAMVTAQARFASANQQLGREKPGFIADSPLIQQYKGKLADLEVELVSLSETYTDKHPKVIANKAAIAETRTKLASEIARVVSADAPSMNPIHQALLQGKMQAEADISATTAQKKAIDKLMGDGEKRLDALPAKQQGLVKVMRDASVAQEIYIMLAKRHEEARIGEVMEPTEIQVIDTANAPEKPVSPKKALNIVIAAIVGLLAGCGYVFMQEHLNRSVRNSDDVKRYLDIPVLGNIPDFDSDTRLTEPVSLWERLKDLGRTSSRTAKKGRDM